jgi:hypothetical protein
MKFDVNVRAMSFGDCAIGIVVGIIIGIVICLFLLGKTRLCQSLDGLVLPSCLITHTICVVFCELMGSSVD